MEKLIHGFELKRQKLIPEIDAEAFEFIHLKTGASLLYLKTEDDNKVFSIAFRTPPQDDTGVAHIVEHSTLCGSKKYPLREPFVELIKGSLHTFLNAMTYPDKTVYPIASRNDQDFQNLMDVYLDAVFYPRVYTTPEILQQEGWHYEIDSPEDDLRYSGVVYNEMKGALSSPDDILASKILRSLFPDTTYQFESGGDPFAIPNLTQEMFLDFHHRYYHPSNSYIYLYGDFDIEEKLEYLDREYLSKFEKLEIDSTIQRQQKFDSVKRFDEFYPIGEDEESDSKTFLSMNFVAADVLDRKTLASLSLLNHALFESPAAPLRKAFIDSGICKDVSTMFETDVMQPVFGIVLQGSELEHVEKFKSILFDNLKKIAAEGIDRKLLTAAINSWEFSLRESDFGVTPPGLVYNLRALQHAIYDGDAFDALGYEDLLASVKSETDTRYFETLIEKCILNNSHATLVTLAPSKTLAAERSQKVRDKLRAKKESMSREEIEKIVENTKSLKEFQSRADSPEALETIPILKRSDLKRSPEKLPLEKISDQFFASEVSTHGIFYANFFFDAAKIPQDRFFHALLISDLLGFIDTKSHSYEDLSTLINTELGGISFDIHSYENHKARNSMIPKFQIKAKVLTSRKPALIEIVREILTETIFTNKSRILELLEQEKIEFELNLQRSAQSLVTSRILSQLSRASAYNFEAGLPYYRFVRDLIDHFDERFETLAAELDSTLKIMINRNDLLIHVTTNRQTIDEFQNNLPMLLDSLPAEKIPSQKYEFDSHHRNEGFTSQSQVQYVGKGANFIEQGFKFTGAMNVLSTILRYEYFWTKIRVQGGAYGAFVNFFRTGDMYFCSYRDPNLQKTLKIFDGTGDFIRSLNLSPREMDKYVIGTLSSLDTPLTPRMRGDAAIQMYLRSVNYEDRQKSRSQTLDVTLDDIHKLADLIDACMNENIFCVFGNDDKINSEKDLFDEIIPVLA